MMRMRWVLVVLSLCSCGGDGSDDNDDDGTSSGVGGSGGSTVGAGGGTGCQLVTSEGDGSSCGYGWSCPDGDYGLTCTPSTVTPSTDCTCNPGLTVPGHFANPDLCPYGSLGLYTPEDVAWIANNECGWSIPTNGGPERWACAPTGEQVTEDFCAWSFSCAVGTIDFACDGAGSDYGCTCTINGTAMASFHTGTFCDAVANGTWGPSTLRFKIESNCGVFLE